MGGEHGVRGGVAATAGGVVHHVVVEQCERVHQLERGTGVDHDGVGGVAPGADEPPVAKGGPQPLPTDQHQAPDLVDRLGEVVVERCPTSFLGCQELGQALLDPRRDDGERGRNGRRGHDGQARASFTDRDIGERSAFRAEIGHRQFDLRPGSADPIAAEANECGRPLHLSGEHIDVDICRVEEASLALRPSVVSCRRIDSSSSSASAYPAATGCSDDAGLAVVMA